VRFLELTQREVFLSDGSSLVADGTGERGAAVKLGSAGAYAQFSVSGRQLGLLLRRHPWSGTAEITIGQDKTLVNLYSDDHQPLWLTELPIESDGHIDVTIRATGDTHPNARGAEVWITGVYTSDTRENDLAAAVNSGVAAEPFTSADLNQLTDVFDWYNPDWTAELVALNSSPEYHPPDFVHRKAWEWGQCMYGIKALDMLQPDSQALGVGVGYEPISYALSNHLEMVVATDLYEGWGTWGTNEGDPDVLENPDKYASIPYRKDHVRFERMDGTRLEFPDNSFDLVWSCSSIEHFGGHEGSSRSMREIERVLKPGGIAAVITEFVLAQDKTSPYSGYHPEYFNLRCLYEYLIRPVPALELVQPLDFSMPSYYKRRPCKLPEEAKAPHEGIDKPHIVLLKEGCLFTSVAMFLRKRGA
jgi:SAM-dependent methyltransferase